MYQRLIHFLLLGICLSLSGMTHAFDKDKTEQRLKTIQQTYHLPGIQATLIDLANKRTYHYAVGYRELKHHQPLSSHHLMQIGSTTKSFIATLALLIEADSDSGKLNKTFNLEQPLKTWLPQYSDWGDVKLRQLLNMTSGIFNYTDDSALFQDLVAHPKKTLPANLLLKTAYQHSPNQLFAPGTDYAYSNTNYILMGQVIEKVTGLPLKEVIDTRLLKHYPKIFKRTFFEPNRYPTGHLHQLAHGYAMSHKDNVDLYGKDITRYSLSWAQSAGAIVSDSEELASWIALLFNQTILPKKQQSELVSLVCTDERCTKGHPIPSDSDLNGYGLGVGRLIFSTLGVLWTHSGATLGYHSIFIYIPSKALVVSVLINQIGPEIGEYSDTQFVAKVILDNYLD